MVLKAHLSPILNIIRLITSRHKCQNIQYHRMETFLFKSKTCKSPSRKQSLTKLSLTKPKTLFFGHTFESNFLLATTKATCLPNCLVVYNSSSYHPYLSVSAKNLN